MLSQAHLKDLHSLLVLKDDQLVLEEYFNGYTREDLHEAQSITKSLQSILIGIALDIGFITNLQERIFTFFEDETDIRWGLSKKRINIYHLLTMTTGLKWNESLISYQNLVKNDSNRMAHQGNWIQYALNKSMVFQPGECFNYSSAAPILFSKIIQQSTGLSNEAFAYNYLFKPLGIHHYAYQRDPLQEEILGDIELRPIDLLKIGQLMLKRGWWGDIQIVSSNWIRQSTQAHIEFFNPYQSGYGYFWWQAKFPYADTQVTAYYAWGYGGQHIFIIPNLDLVIVTTGGWYDVNLAYQPFQLVQEVVLKELSCMMI